MGAIQDEVEREHAAPRYGAAGRPVSTYSRTHYANGTPRSVKGHFVSSYLGEALRVIADAYAKDNKSETRMKVGFALEVLAKRGSTVRSIIESFDGELVDLADGTCLGHSNGQTLALFATPPAPPPPPPPPPPVPKHCYADVEITSRAKLRDFITALVLGEFNRATANLLDQSFNWYSTPQGGDFWMNVYEDLSAGRDPSFRRWQGVVRNSSFLKDLYARDGDK